MGVEWPQSEEEGILEENATTTTLGGMNGSTSVKTNDSHIQEGE